MLVLVCLAAPAFGGKTRKGDVAVPTPAPRPEVVELKGKLFPKELPFDVGARPPGLANDSWQGCAACHPAAADAWSGSAHARGPSDLLEQAAIGRPACLACHLPLAPQHPELFDYAGREPVGTPNPAFSATLRLESVTCGACHVRDGAIVAGTDLAAARPAPHPLIWGEALGTSEACAACHQLSWPGAAEPLYDTFGEWKRSAFAEAGITCQACHMLGAAEGGAVDHGVAIPPERAVSVLLDVSTLTMTRGGAPVPAVLVLQNTGAGHAFPTGTPFAGVRVSAALVPPPAPAVPPAPDAPIPPAPEGPIRLLDVDLARTVDPAPPFGLLGDTRLQAGEARRFDLALALPTSVPGGTWTLRIRFARTVGGTEVGEPWIERNWELVVQ